LGQRLIIHDQDAHGFHSSISVPLVYTFCLTTRDRSLKLSPIFLA